MLKKIIKLFGKQKSSPPLLSHWQIQKDLGEKCGFFLQTNYMEIRDIVSINRTKDGFLVISSKETGFATYLLSLNTFCGDKKEKQHLLCGNAIGFLNTFFDVAK